MTFRTIEVQARDVVARWRELKEDHPQTGLYPFVIGFEDEAVQLREVRQNAFESGWDPDDDIQRAEAALTMDSLTGASTIHFEEEAARHPIPEESSGRPTRWPLFVQWGDDVPEAEVIIGLIECAEPWHLPAHLAFGSPHIGSVPCAVHCEHWKRWHDNYGADIAMVGVNRLEAEVRNPPLTYAQAFPVAVIQTRYLGAHDMASRMETDIPLLARDLVNSSGWFFSWNT